MINKFKIWIFIKSEILFIEPVNKLSKQITLCPNLRRALQRCDPIKPAPPVTKIFFFYFLPSPI